MPSGDRNPSFPNHPSSSPLSAFKHSPLLFQQQIHQLYTLAPYGILASIVNASILGILFWGVIQKQIIVIWLLNIVVINALWSLLIYFYRRHSEHNPSFNKWKWWFISGNVVSGLIWGAAGVFLYPFASIGHEILLTFVIGGMIAGSTAVHASYFPAYLAYSLPAVTPITIQFLSRGDVLHFGMGIMGILFVTIMTITARRNNTMITESMTLQIENSSLINVLTQAKDRAETLNRSLTEEIAQRKSIEKELRRHRNHLETLVEARTAELQKSESRYRFVTEHISDVIWMMELDASRFSYMSPSIKELLGYTTEEAMNMSLQECLTPASFAKAKSIIDQETARLTSEPGKQGPSVLLELEHLCKDGSTVWAEVRGSLLLDEKGHPLGFTGVTRDLTERRKMDAEKRQLEAQLLRSQKLDAIGTLAGGIAHDFNNLLTSILGNITLIQHIVKLTELGETYLARAEQAALRAKDLTQQLLAFARGGEPIKHLLSLDDLITECSGFALSGSSVSLQPNFAKDLWPIEADPGQISQAIHNIVINAVQAMPNGGNLTITAENMSIHDSFTDPNIPLSPGPYVKVVVIDEGMGIRKDHIDKIFEPYFSTKTDGQGLGLASTYAIIKKHGGHIAVKSQPNIGTQFTLYFPACASGAKPVPYHKLSLSHGRGKILFMDDEESIRMLGREMLGHCGYQCVVAKDGYEALTFFKEAIETQNPFSAVILDLTIPGSLGGKETIRRLREIDPQVKAFVSSGYSNDPIMANYSSYGFLGVISKPYSLVGLSHVLHRIQRESPFEGSAKLKIQIQPTSEFSDSEKR